MSAATTPILWKDPGPIESMDLAAGPGGRNGAPKPPFQFIKEDSSGTSPKFMVRDAAGMTWSVKFGDEARPETFANRIVWAAGYLPQVTYLLREGSIEGMKPLQRRSPDIDDSGRFRNARFQTRDEATYKLVEGSKWNLDASALKGTKELAGLKLLLILLSNWDPKVPNRSIVDAGGQQYYAITDWGASLGRMGDFRATTKWDCKGYTFETQAFHEGADNGYAVLPFTGREGELVSRDIKVDDVRWFMQRMGKLSDAQIRSALEASGATPDEVACFGSAIRTRLNAYKAIVDSTGEGGEIVRTRTVTKTTTTTKPKQ